MKSIRKISKTSQLTETSEYSTVIGEQDLAQPRPRQSVRISERTFYSEHEVSKEAALTDVEETGENDYEDYETSSRTVRISDSPSQHYPLSEDFFLISSLSLSSEETSEDTVESVESYVQPPLEEEQDFFENLGNVPDMAQVSRESIERQSTLVPAKSSLQGQFVDPLTGKIVVTDTAKTPIVDFELEEEGEEEEEIEDSTKIMLTDVSPAYEEFSFDDYDTRFPMPVEKTFIALQEEDEDLTLLLAAHEAASVHTSFNVPRPQKTLAQHAFEQTEKFLNDLVTVVVRYCEQEQSNQLVKKKLDKEALFREVRKLVTELEVEKKVNTFLNRKCVEHHRRKGNVRYLQEDKPEKVLQDLAAFKEKSEYLNSLLGKELVMMKKTNKEVSELMRKADMVEEERRTEIATFENLVRKTLKCNTSPALEKVVSTQLRHMGTLREEISSTRSVIILRQHTLGTLRARLHELENIGNGLHLADYEALQREMMALGKKIEDRNRELGKMHGRFHHNLHSMAHTKIKTEVTIASITEKLFNLKDLEHEERLTRERLFRMNLSHKGIRRQLQDLSLQCGLLDKPDLLRDYDETMGRLTKQRSKVQDMKQTLSDMETKLKQLQKAENLMPDTNTKSADKSKTLKLKSPAESMIDGLGVVSLKV